MKTFKRNLLFKSLYFLPLLLVLFITCNKPQIKKSKTLFSLVDNNHTSIHFTNRIIEDLHFNFLNYSYIYNGAGISVGDINNDGLQDIYFTSNQGSNKLYINKGNFEFEDITTLANVTDEEGWSTGTTMIDINNDGWLDIYVCKSGSLDNHELRKNKLYINQKDNTFKESAAYYGLDHFGFSTQAYFFDYDNDSDLDLYLVNHRQDFQNNTSINLTIQKNIQPYNSDQLFRNEGGKFVNVSSEAGIINKAWGLSASIGDFNDDSLNDIYVANDFLEPDFLYINQGDGTFKDEILQRFDHIPTNSMGSDYMDVNNDLQPDLIVLEMVAEDHIRSKENMPSMSTENFNLLVNSGYHYQYMANMLQLNNGNGTFNEIGHLAGIAKTDWSWAPLIADFDNDGYNDLFVTNGIENDLSNQDFRNQMRQNIMNRKKVTLEEAIKMMPSTKVQNYIYKNNGDLTFTNNTKEWGLDLKVNSNGAAYADLDNDGDLDIIVNNQSDKAHIYKNNASNNFANFSLEGPDHNKNGIGSIINLFANGFQQSKQLFVSRGYQSSVTHKLHFGIGNIEKIDSIEVIWYNGSKQLISNVDINKNITINYANAKTQKQVKRKLTPLFEDIDPNEIGINYQQKENDFNDFDLQLLLPQKQSEVSSAIAIADVNNDGLEDFFVGNAKDARASLFIQKRDGTFIESNQELLDSERCYEDTDVAFIDIDNDKDFDLYVASGGYEVEQNSELLQDRLYINDGKGNYIKTNNLPKMLTNTKTISTADYDDDGDIDIFIGSRVKHGKYPLVDTSYLLENQNGKFVDVTSKKINDISEIKITNDAVFSDYDNDGDKDLVVVGEWMPIIFFENVDHQFVKKEMDELEYTNGWYQSIIEVDLDDDGNKDYIIGNWGDNNKFHPTKEKPLHIYADYLDDNSSFDVVLSKISNGDLLPVRGKECSSQQTPFLNNKLKTFKEFASSTLPEIYGQENLDNASHFEVYDFKSIILKNKGNGYFEIQNLPAHAQFSPTLGVEIHDFNKDGCIDIFGVGNVFDAEVETIRYDASKGYILLGNDKGDYKFSNDTSYFNYNEAKAIKKIIINNIVHFIILNKNSELKILKLT